METSAPSNRWTPKLRPSALPTDDRDVTYEFTELDELILAYAISVTQVPGVRIPCRHHPFAPPALSSVATKPIVYCYDPR